MPQKFAELQVGQAFVFEGQSYVKSSPLMGRGESGHERLIPRSALVETGSPVVAPHAAPERMIPASKVTQALRAFSARVGDAAHAGEFRRAMTELERELGLTDGE